MERKEKIEHAARMLAATKRDERAYNQCLYDFEMGAEWADENPKQVWHDAQGEYLPEYDREVIAICGANGQICFAHRPNPKGWFGKSLTTGKASHYEPKTYGVGGWNLEDVVFWLDVEIPHDQIEARLDMM